MTTSIEFDAVPNSTDEPSAVGEHPISAGVQVAQAATGQAAQPAGEPVPVDVGSGAAAQGTANAPAANAPAANTAASNVTHEYHAEAGNVVKLPANVSIDNIKVDGHNLVLQQPDGSEIVIKDGALNVPTFIIGDVEVPRVALIAALEASHVDVAFGADGSISAGGNGSPNSAGGNFQVPPGGIGDGFGLTSLLPPTALQFGQPDNRELFPSLLKPDSTPSIGTIGGASVNEAGLPARNGEPEGSDSASNSETTSGTIGFTSPDGVSEVTLGGHVLTGAPQTFTDATGSLTASYTYDPATGTGSISYTYTLLDNTSGDNTSVSFAVGVTDSDGDATPPGSLVINIIDDAPTAVADTDVVPSGSHAAIDGNVITGAGSDGNAAGADVKGADDVTVVGVAAGTTAGGEDANVGTVIQGTYGKLTLNADGSYSYTRDAGTPGGHDDVFTYTIKDGDGDLSHTTLTISIGDSTPTIGGLTPQAQGGDTTVNEKGLPASSGSEGSGELAAPGADGDPSEHNTGTFTISSPDGIAKLTINGTDISAAALANSGTTHVDVTTPDGNTLTITGYDAGTGQVSYTYTLLDNETHSGAGTDSIFDNMTVTVTDTDGDASSGTLSVQIVDDVPTANLDTNSIASGQFGPVSGNVLANDVIGADGPATTSPAGGIVGVVAGTTAGGEDANVGTVIQGTYGKLTLNADGSYSYTRDAGTPGGHDDVFTYTIKDGDGDLSHTTLTISIGNSTPTIGGLTPQAQGGDTTVNEKGLPASSGSEGSGELAAPGADGDPSEHNTGTFTISSPDGIAKLTINGTDISAAALANSGTTHVDVTTPDGNTLTITGYDAGTGQVSYTYTLLDNETHSGAGIDSIFDNMTVTVTDTDGDASSGTLSVQIVDDVPTANLDTNSIASGQFGPVSGNVLANDVIGADGPATTSPAGGIVGVVAGTTAGGEDANVGTVIQGTYGKLTLNADGSYSYTRDAGTPGGHDDVFTYTIKDGDGDLSHTTLTISIGNSTPTIGGLTPQAQGGDTTVNEKGLPASSGSEGSGELAAPGADGDPSEHNTGTFTISSPDGIAKLTINGTDISAAALANSGTTHVDVTTPDGNTLTITGYDAGTGQVSYTYTLLDNETHSGAGIDSIFDNMTVTVTDTDGDASSGTLSVQIVDDVPTANLDTNSIASGQFGPVSGNVLANDVIGADGPATTSPAGGIFGVVAGTTAGGEDANVGTVIQGTYGKLTLNADGSYSYTRDAGTPGGHDDVFTYTIKDGDGDLSHTTLTISIGDSTPTIGGLTPQAQGGDTTVNEKGLPASSGSEGSGELAAPGADGDPSEHNTGTFTISSPDGIAKLTINGTDISAAALANSGTTHVDVTTPDGNTLTITGYDAGTGQVSYTYTLLDNETHSGAGIDSIFDNMTVTVTDTDGDASSGTLSVQIVDDVPTANLDTNSIASGQFGPVSGNVLANDVIGADGPATTSPAGGIFGVVAGTTAGGEDANVGTVIQGTYGKLTLNADGSYSYTRDAGTPGGHDDVFTYTIKDGDGDLSHTTLTISIGDSTPTIGGLTPQAQGGDTTVNEKGLPASSGSEGSGELAAPGADGDPSEHNTGTFTISSPDGIAKLTINGTDISAAALANSGTTHVDVTTPDGNTLTITGYDAGTGQVSYTYTLLDNETHSGAGIDSIFDNMTVTVTDTDGDASSGTLSVQIVDDVPTANLDTNSIASGQFGPVSGNVLANDVIGADGPATTSPAGGIVGVVAGTTAGGEDANVGTVIQGTYGKLTLNADGSYSYTRDAGTPGGHDDVFTYTIKDGDGDLSHTTLTISIGNSTPTIGGLTPQAQGGDVTVNEDDLLAGRGAGESAGSDTSKESTTQGGTFNVSSPDGIATLSIDGHAFITNGVFTAGSFTTALGNTLNVTGYNAATGVVTYTYTLNDNEAHAAGQGTNSLFENFTVSLTDQDGQNATGTLSANIGDDVPTAHNDTNSAQSGQTVTGNVETNDTAGADGIASIAWTGASGNTVTGSYGTLTIAADGSYSYHANPNASGTEVFTYTITDGDGDTSPATLTITVTNGQPQPAAATQTVNEAALDTTTTGSDIAHGTVTGSNPSSTAETVSGTLSLGDPDSPHVTNIQGATSSVVGGSAVTVQGTYGVLQIDQNGNYTYTLTKPFDTSPDANNGTNTETGKDVFTYTVTDAYGNTSTSTISINIIDDVRTAPVPDYAVLSNGAGNPVTFALDEDHTLTGNYGADGPGTVQFATSLDGVDSGLTSGGTHIIYDVSADGHTLYGMANNVAVFTVTLDPTNATYSVDMNGTVDSVSQVTFSNGSYDFDGGNGAWAGFVPTGQKNSGTPVNDDSRDVLFTPFGTGTTINGNANSFGVGGGSGGQNIGAGEGIRVDFVQDLTGNTMGAGGYGVPANRDHVFDSHYVANGATFTFGDGTSNTLLKITAFDDNATTGTDGNKTVGDGVHDSVTSVAITYDGETQMVSFADIGTTATSYTVGNSGGLTDRTYTVHFVDLGDGKYAAEITGVLDTHVSVSTFTADGYSSLELLNASPTDDSGNDFAITGFGAAVQTTDPVNFNLPIEIVDGDGDKATSEIGVTLYGTGVQDHSADAAGASHLYTSTVALPNIIGSAFNDTITGDVSANVLYGGAGADTINGSGGNDTLVGGAGNDIMNGGAGNDLLVGGAGQDTLTGGTGADTFKLDHLDIKDLISDYNGAEGDKIDLSSLFETSGGNIADYVHYDAGTKTLSVDVNGTTGGANFVDVAVLQNAPAAGTITILYDDNNHTQHSTTI